MDNAFVALALLAFGKRANAHTIKCYYCTDVCTFVPGKGQRDNDIIIIGGNGGAHGDVHHGRCGANDADGNAYNSLC